MKIMADCKMQSKQLA